MSGRLSAPLRSRRRARAGGAGAGFEVRLKLGDQLSEIGGLAGKLRRPRPLVGERLLGVRLPFLPLVDQQRQALAVVGEHQEVAAEAVAFLGDLLAQPHQRGGSAASFGLHPHLGRLRSTSSPSAPAARAGWSDCGRRGGDQQSASTSAIT
jgi:hypothetical protein